MSWNWVGAAGLALALAACGTNSQDRTQGGAAAGAATGAGIGAFGGPVGALAGAAIGGGVGAVTGATTSPRDVNLGTPPWSNPEVRTPVGEGRRARRGRTATARANDPNKAYMGGGMVGTDAATGTTATPAPAAGGGTAMTTAPVNAPPMTGPMTTAPMASGPTTAAPMSTAPAVVPPPAVR